MLLICIIWSSRVIFFLAATKSWVRIPALGFLLGVCLYLYNHAWGFLLLFQPSPTIQGNACWINWATRPRCYPFSHLLVDGDIQLLPCDPVLIERVEKAFLFGVWLNAHQQYIKSPLASESTYTFRSKWWFYILWFLCHILHLYFMIPQWKICFYWLFFSASWVR